MTADYDGADVTDLKTSWNNGLGFCALVAEMSGGQALDYASVPRDNSLAALNLAFEAATQSPVDVPRFLEAEMLADAKSVDERSMMTYLGQFFHRFVYLKRKRGAARIVEKQARFAREHGALQVAFNEALAQARATLAAENERLSGFVAGSSLSDARGRAESLAAWGEGTGSDLKDVVLQVRSLPCLCCCDCVCCA